MLVNAPLSILRFSSPSPTTRSDMSTCAICPTISASVILATMSRAMAIALPMSRPSASDDMMRRKLVAEIWRNMIDVKQTCLAVLPVKSS